jgi:O-succinylbenzoate synthase
VKKYKIPKLEYFVFLDHVKDSKDLMICALVGEAIEETHLKLVVRTWTMLEAITEFDRAVNEDHYTLIKSTIKQRTKLYPRVRK